MARDVVNESVTVKAIEAEGLLLRGFSSNSAQATPNAGEAQQSSNGLRTTDVTPTSTSYVNRNVS